MEQSQLSQDYKGFTISGAAALQPWPSEAMEAWDVSPLVNALANDSAAYIQKLIVIWIALLVL